MVGSAFNNITILDNCFPYNVENSIQCVKQTTACLINQIVPGDSALECTETRRTNYNLSVLVKCVKVGNNEMLLSDKFITILYYTASRLGIRKC
jgi:hypothetical protein